MKQVPSEENLGKQGFYYVTKQLFEPITKQMIKTKKNYWKFLKQQLQKIFQFFKIYRELVKFKLIQRKISISH